MATLTPRSLIGKLNDTCRHALDSAAGMSMSSTHYNVELEHWLAKLVAGTDNDLAALFRYYEIDVSRLQRDLTAAMDKFKRGNSRPPALSPNVVRLMQEAWLIGSVEFQSPQVRSGHLLCAALGDDSLSLVVRDVSSEFSKIAAEALRKDLLDITADSAESRAEASAPAAKAGGGPVAAQGGALDQFTIDLTDRARQGAIDPVLGRDTEIRQIIDILTRRRQNNPILTGEAGVGKTAVVEGFAQRVAEGDVPPSLKDVAIRTLDLGLLQAGAGIKGEFENRLKSVIDEVKASPKPIILFIDEAHTLIGAGGSAGQGDAANLLKPALARGELRTVAATTWAEYKKYFEKDAALARRFQVVKVEEPTEAKALEMMEGLVKTLEKHHGVRILDEGVADAVKLSHRYISGRQLPDKAVSLLDTACARVGLSQSATPPQIEDCRRRIDYLGTSIAILEREAATGIDHSERLSDLTTSQSAAEAELSELEERWEREKELVAKVRELRGALEAAHGGDEEEAGADAAAAAAEKPSAEELDKARTELAAVQAELRSVQGESPLLQVCVDSQAVAEVVSNWTGIPVGRMVTDEIRTVLSLRQRLEDRVVGQSHALEAIAQSIRTSRANLTDPEKPIGVFMLVGPSGVGKTETAISLAELMYGGDQNLTTINMSEFKEEHKVSLLMGSPPGYVGYGEGGVLTEAVRRKPYSVVLLDELEKAHEGVQEIFYQVFDKGTLRDGEGRDIDFRNTVILATSNAGTDLIAKVCDDPDTRPDPEQLQKMLHEELLKTFKPAFLGRVTLIPYYPLTDDVMKMIIRLKLGKVMRRIAESYRAVFSYSDGVVDSIAERCTEVESGARNVDHILTRTLLPELSTEFLSHLADGATVRKVHVTVSDGGAFAYALE